MNIVRTKGAEGKLTVGGRTALRFEKWTAEPTDKEMVVRASPTDVDEFWCGDSYNYTLSLVLGTTTYIWREAARLVSRSGDEVMILVANNGEPEVRN